MVQPQEHLLRAQALQSEAFSPYGQVISPRIAGEQFDSNSYDPESNPEEAQLVLNNGQPRLWIMRIKRRGLVFSKMARHRRVSQCLGALHAKDWFLAVAPPDARDDAELEIGKIAVFRISGDCVVKLHVGTWHAGPHFTHEECLFLNLENMDTNKRDFQSADLLAPCRIVHDFPAA